MSEQSTVTFHYLNARDFRTAHADGVIGGVTPQGSLHMSFYAQRPAVPQSVTQPLKEDGNLGDPIDTQGGEGIVRELQVDLLLALSTAKEVHYWLGERIKQLEERLPAAGQQNTQNR